MWTPQSQQRPGSLRKITSSIDFDKRLQTVRDWNTEGGVLIMSYDIFRTWILNKETKVKGRQPADQESHQDNLQEEARGRKCLPKEKHEQVKDWLLKGPSIIVADEAHKMKNSNTGIYQAAVQFRSKSRIALTGSPLANNLIDYYTMVNWIADGYLGEYKQFKANYVEPIEEGLYTDSTHAERRKSLVKLQVLKEILEPKVNRADISALAGSLPPKVEFVMTIPLTKLQTEAYNLYVNSVFGGLGDVRNPKLWSWLAILGLCCNHPKCFWDKLNSRTNETQMPAQEREYSSPGEEPIDQVGLPDSASLVSRQKPLFAVPDLKDLNLSYRTLMLDKIISESVKVGDKILVFSHSLPTLNYIEDVLRSSNRRYCRLDGRTPMGSRQSATKAFNNPGADQVYLISTRAGGLGLNIPGANRVVIFDFQFNPVWEEQAVGRVYRLGQQKPVFVYRFISGGTYEEKIFGKAIFKTHLANRVVDKKNPVRWASKSIGEYLRPAGPVPQKDLTEFIGKDPHVLDKIIANDNGPEKIIRKITLTETLQREDNDNLTEEEKKGVEMHLSDERLKRTDPQAYHELMMRREADMAKALAEQSLYMHSPAQPVHSSQVYPHHVSHNVGPRPLPPDMSVSGPTVSANVGGYPSSIAGSYSLSGTSLFQPVTSTSRIPHPPAGGPPPPSTSQAVTTAPAESNLTTAQSNYMTNPHHDHEVLSPESQDYESAAEEVTKSPQQNPKSPAKDRSASDCKTQ